MVKYTAAQRRVRGEIVDKYKTGIFEGLKSVSSKGDFAFGDTLQDAPQPDIELNLSGKPFKPEKWPLVAEEVQQIIAGCDVSPFGLKEKTVIDKKVRYTWQLEPEKVKIGEQYQQYINATLLPKMQQGFGLSGQLQANFYKLLVYEKDGFFLPHRDSEKENNMISTLIVQLPSKYQGGELIVNHMETSKRFDFSIAASPGNSTKTHFCAFFCDCEHEVLPVTAGYRICLVYNIVYTPANFEPTNPATRKLVNQIAHLIEQWNLDDYDQTPCKMAFLLQHHYTPAGLSFGTLKSSDKELAYLLKEVQRKVVFMSVYLGLVTLHQLGYPKGQTWYEDEDTTNIEGRIKKMSDVIKSDTKVDILIDLDDRRDFTVSKMNITDAEVNVEMKKISGTEDPNSLKLKATGNDGVLMDRWYHRAVLIFWPWSKDTRVYEGIPLQNCVENFAKMAQALNSTNEVSLRPRTAHMGYAIVHKYKKNTCSKDNIPPVLQGIAALKDEDLLNLFAGKIEPTEAPLGMLQPTCAAVTAFRWGKMKKVLHNIFSWYANLDTHCVELLHALVFLGDRTPFNPTKDKLNVLKDLATNVLAKPLQISPPAPTPKRKRRKYDENGYYEEEEEEEDENEEKFHPKSKYNPETPKKNAVVLPETEILWISRLLQIHTYLDLPIEKILVKLSTLHLEKIQIPALNSFQGFLSSNGKICPQLELVIETVKKNAIEKYEKGENFGIYISEILCTCNLCSDLKGFLIGSPKEREFSVPLKKEQKHLNETIEKLQLTDLKMPSKSEKKFTLSKAQRTKNSPGALNECLAQITEIQNRPIVPSATSVNNNENEDDSLDPVGGSNVSSGSGSSAHNNINNNNNNNNNNINNNNISNNNNNQ
eukprot:TRINITY_DN2885_c0_g2_i1.p1 TRINITY_DN2885_c0_g2~~TRINITY_DN2885_c0_g2_i1.p1  ORF type:complete len:874 (-),score=195.62 TRINITY_DN2885_c0_g2_i1:101-2722(-)